MAVKNLVLCKRCWKRQGVKPTKKSTIAEKDCKLCFGAFTKLVETGKRVVKTLKSLPGTKTFLVGTRMPKDSERFEEKVWGQVDITKVENIKSELNREIGKWVEKNSKYRFSSSPDVRLTVDWRNGDIETQISSIYLYGRYKKLKRNVRQTKKRGSSEPSVEALIEKPLLEITKGEKAVLHGAGREDIDVLMVGGGRPFVIEVTKPKVRKFSPKAAEKAINKKAKGMIKVEALKQSEKGLVEVIKRAKFDKTYEAIVELDKAIKLTDMAKLPMRVVLAQRTPTRVANRRADLVRKRTVKKMTAKLIDKKHIKMELTTQAGTYIKEFISGDDGRTQPSISSMLGRNAKCKELTVTSIDSGWLEDFW